MIVRDTYGLTMARVTITVPDELLARATAAGLNLSHVTAVALVEELERQAKRAELDAYLAELENELGPVPPDEAAEAREWVNRLQVRFRR